MCFLARRLISKKFAARGSTTLQLAMKSSNCYPLLTVNDSRSCIFSLKSIYTFQAN